MSMDLNLMPPVWYKYKPEFSEEQMDIGKCCGGGQSKAHDIVQDFTIFTWMLRDWHTECPANTSFSK